MASRRDKLRNSLNTETRKEGKDIKKVFQKVSRDKKVKIDPELRSLIPPLQAEELVLLESSIREEGVRENLKLWQPKKDVNDFLLIDGHNRYSIIKKLETEGVNVSYDFDILSFSSANKVNYLLKKVLNQIQIHQIQRSLLLFVSKDIH